MFSNGSEEVVQLSVYEIANPENLLRKIVTYTVDNNNRYALTPVETNAPGAVTLRNRTGLPSGVTANNATTFIVEDSAAKTYKVYEGMRNMPNVAGENAYIYSSDGAAIVVFVTNAVITTSSSDVIFIAANSASNPIVEKSYTYRTFRAVVDGQMTSVNILVGTTLGSKAENPEPGAQFVVANNSVKPSADSSIILNNTEYNADGFMIAGSYESSTVNVGRAQGLTAPSNGSIRLGGVPMDLSGDVNVYSVASATGAPSKISLNNVRADSNDWVYYTQDNRDITNLFILRVD